MITSPYISDFKQSESLRNQVLDLDSENDSTRREKILKMRHSYNDVDEET